MQTGCCRRFGFKILNFRGDDGVNKKKDGNVDGTNKWSEYGCFCTAHQERIADGHWVGKGEPVDKIDYLCRQLWWGYKCLSRDFTACSAEIAYDWSVGKDGKPTCTNDKDTCQGDLCRLDLQFVRELKKNKNSWTKDFHLKNGFDRAGTCAPKKSSQKKPSQGKTTVTSECCGIGISRSIYKPDRQECCKDGSVRPMGSC